MWARCPAASTLAVTPRGILLFWANTMSFPAPQHSRLHVETPPGAVKLYGTRELGGEQVERRFAGYRVPGEDRVHLRDRRSGNVYQLPLADVVGSQTVATEAAIAAVARAHRVGRDRAAQLLQDAAAALIAAASASPAPPAPAPLPVGQAAPCPSENADGRGRRPHR